MTDHSLVLWLIAIPLLASPVIYLLGRLFQHQQVSPARWIALAALAASWVPFGLAVQAFLAGGPLESSVEAISLRLDGLSLLLAGVALALSTLVVLFSGPYMAGESGEEKYYAMLVAMTGVMIALGCAADLFNLWVWFEAMAVTSYLLVVFYQEQPASLEAGVKYVVQSASGSVLVLLGIALVLAQVGTLDLNEISGLVRLPSAQTQPLLLAAGALFVIGFGVKTALVPMHTWLPDAHTQAPSGISAMLSGVVIEAGLVAMLRSLSAISGSGGQAAGVANWGWLLIAFGALNMLVGNLMALRQKQVKRLLAYSSLAHVGYITFGIGVAIFAGQMAGAQGGLFHLLNHGLMKSLAFLAAGALLFAISGLGAPRLDVNGEPVVHGPLMISDLDGAARRYPLAALAFSLAVLGLGGLPPLAGFTSKWQIFVAGFGAHNALIAGLVVFAALNSVLSLAYYAPLVNALYRKQPSPTIQHGASIPGLMNVPLALLAAAVVALGLWPNLASWLTGPAGQSLMSAFGW